MGIKLSWRSVALFENSLKLIQSSKNNNNKKTFREKSQNLK